MLFNIDIPTKQSFLFSISVILFLLFFILRISLVLSLLQQFLLHLEVSLDKFCMRELSSKRQNNCVFSESWRSKKISSSFKHPLSDSAGLPCSSDLSSEWFKVHVRMCFCYAWCVRLPSLQLWLFNLLLLLLKGGEGNYFFLCFFYVCVCGLIVCFIYYSFVFRFFLPSPYAFAFKLTE